MLPGLQAYIAWRRALRTARADGRPDPPPPAEHAPASINLDLTTACNYHCDHCIDGAILNSGIKHREDELRASVRRMAERGLRSVILIGGGEPTLYPRFTEFTRELKALELQVAVVSNGSRGDKLLEVADALDEHDWIRLSLDSGSNELFRAMHLPVGKDTDLDEICSWIPKIKRRNPRVRLGFSYVIVWRGAQCGDTAVHENIHEIVLAAQRAKESGFDYISLKPFLQRTTEGAEVMEPGSAAEEQAAVLARIRAEVERAKELADDGFDVYESTNLRRLEDGTWRELTRQPHTCHVQALRQVLTPTGLFNCPAHRGVPKARIAGPDAFADDERATQTTAGLADILDGFDAAHECREVTCLYNQVNWWIEKMVEDERGDGPIAPVDSNEDFFL